MKKLLLLGTLTLAGCATGAPPPSTTPGVLSPLVKADVISEDTRTKARQVQAEAAKYCRFVPTIGTILSIISAGVGGPATVIATAICDSVTTVPLADGGPRAAKAYGIPIKGKFLRKGKR